MKIFTKIAAFAVVALALVAGTSSADAAFTRYLTVGSTGTDVSELQSILVSNGYLASGLPSGYFGALTKSAVMKWQAAVGLPATGYFGPMSIAKIGMGSTSTTGGSTSSNTGSTSGLKGGDGDFKDFDVLGNPDNEEVEEGETVEVFAFEFEADDSDLLVERVEFVASSSLNQVEKPWKVLDEVSIVVDGKTIADVDASDEDNWDEETSFNGASNVNAYSLRFDDVDYKVEEGKTVEFAIAVTATDDLDTDELGDWDIALADDGIRARNAEGIDVYEGNDTDDTTFTLDEATAGDLTVTVDTDDNEDAEVEISEDDSTEDVVIYTAQVESEDGDNNVEEVRITLSTTSATTVGTDFDDMIDTLYLFIDGDEVGSESVDSTGIVTFDDIDVDIEEGDEFAFEVRADINEQGQDEDNYNNGDGVYVTSMRIDFVDAQDDDQTYTDTTNGGDITFSLNALSVDLVSKSAKMYGTQDNKGEYYINFKVSAPEEEDIYIPNGAASSTATNTGAYFKILNTGNNQVTATTSLAELNLVSGGSDEGNGYYKVSKGNTATFELHVVVDNTLGGDRGLKVQFSGVDYNTRALVPGLTRFTSGLDEEYRTSSVLLLTADASN